MFGENVDLQSIVYAAESEANEEYPIRGRAIAVKIHTPRPSFHDVKPVLIEETSASPRSDLAEDDYPSNHSETMSYHSIHSRSSSRTFESPREGDP
jgi:hypothetical protein